MSSYEKIIRSNIPFTESLMLSHPSIYSTLPCLFKSTVIVHFQHSNHSKLEIPICPLLFSIFQKPHQTHQITDFEDLILVWFFSDCFLSSYGFIKMIMIRQIVPKNVWYPITQISLECTLTFETHYAVNVSFHTCRFAWSHLKIGWSSLFFHHQ